MKHRKNILLYFFTISILLSIIPNPDSSVTAFATPQSQGTLLGSARGQNYNDTAYSNGTHIWTTQPSWMNNGLGFTPYVLNQTATNVIVSTQQGSFNFNKNTCSLSFYGGNNTNGTPQIGSDTYSVRAELNGTSNWLNVNTINNAACTTSINQTGNNIEIIGSKTSAGNGVFKIHYLKKDGQYLKTTLEATNNNAGWTNYHLGLSQTVQVPRSVTLGNQTYDLSLYNNTSLDRNWINNHKSQLIQLSNSVYFDFTPAFNHISDIVITYRNGQASLTFDYLYNTPILSPGQTISIDPTYGFTAASTAQQVFGTNTVTASCASGSYASFSHGGANALLMGNSGLSSQCQGILLQWNISSITSVNTVTSTTLQFTTTSQTNAVNCDYMQRLTDWTGLTDAQKYAIIDTEAVTYVTNDSTCTGAAGTYTVVLGSTANTDVKNNAGGTFNVGIRQTPWARNASNRETDFNNANWNLQVVYTQVNKPAAPTLSSVTQISSTSLNASWTSSTGANWYFVNRTSPAGGTLVNVYNVTTLFKVDTGLTPGTQYQYGIQAGNASGLGLVSNKLSKYTVNVAPTALTVTGKSDTIIRLGWTNPTGNFSSFKIEQGNSACTGFATLSSDTGNTTNHYDSTGLSSNTKYCFRVSTNYAKGSSNAGTSSPSSTQTGYTLPSSPTGLTATQNSTQQVHLAWVDGGGNGTVTGFFIEMSTNNGASWSTVIANTGNSSVTYTQNGLAAGKTYWRVSEIKSTGGGTSLPSGTASLTVWRLFTVNAYHANGVTPVYGQAIQANSTSSNNRFTLVSGSVTIPGISNLNNFTAWNSLINFIVGKQYNYNATTNHSLNMTTNDYDVDCSYTGTGTDIELWTNGTDGHRITTFTTPTCFTNNTVKWSTKFTANGNTASSFNTLVYARVVNATFAANATLKYNNTKVNSIYTNPYIVSNSVAIGTGLQTKLFNWSMNLTINPAFVPVNFTVGHISVSGSNPITNPIKFTTTTVNASATAVTVTFPSTYIMGYNVTFGNEGTTQTYTGLPVTSPSLGLGQSTITFKNPSNDFVTIKAYDTTSKTQASTILAQPNTNIPFVTQFKNFKNGLFGTSAMIGGINIVDLIVLMVAMIGLNRANEIVGAFMMVIIVGVAAFFQIITWPTAMVSGIALAVLVTVVTMKKYQNS